MAQSIVSFDIQPAAPTTGDPVSLSARVNLAQDCGWQTTVSVAFGVQSELGPGAGWGFDLEVIRTAATCAPLPIDLAVDSVLGTQPIASAPAVLRLKVDGVVSDTRLFSFAVAAGPAPGWGQPALHGGFQLFTQATALTALPGRLAVNNQLSRA